MHFRVFIFNTRILSQWHRNFENMALTTLSTSSFPSCARYIEIQDLQRSGATTSQNCVSRASWLSSTVSISNFSAYTRVPNSSALWNSTGLDGAGRVVVESRRISNIIFQNACARIGISNSTASFPSFTERERERERFSLGDVLFESYDEAVVHLTSLSDCRWSRDGTALIRP